MDSAGDEIGPSAAATTLLQQLNSRVVRCGLCPRLSEYVRQVGQQHARKPKRFTGEKYWARPLPSFGDPNARMLIVGLAPAAHGGNRTGRMFTGDSSGDWLARAMHDTGFASMPTSRSRDDGLVLREAYITAAVRCAPPSNKPLPSEMASCLQYLKAELDIMKGSVAVVLALGRIAFDAYCRAAGLRGLKFYHGARYSIAEEGDDGSGDGEAGPRQEKEKEKMRRKITLVASYHPSRQNTNTGKLTWTMWIEIFRTVRELVDDSDGDGRL